MTATKYTHSRVARLRLKLVRFQVKQNIFRCNFYCVQKRSVNIRLFNDVWLLTLYLYYRLYTVVLIDAKMNSKKKPSMRMQCSLIQLCPVLRRYRKVNAYSSTCQLFCCNLFIIIWFTLSRKQQAYDLLNNVLSTDLARQDCPRSASWHQARHRLRTTKHITLSSIRTNAPSFRR